MLRTITFLILFTSHIVNALDESCARMEYVGNKKYRVNYSDSIDSIRFAKLEVRDRDGYCILSNETYVIGARADIYDIVIGSVDGYDPSLIYKDSDGLYIEYYRGNGYKVLVVFGYDKVKGHYLVGMYGDGVQHGDYYRVINGMIIQYGFDGTVKNKYEKPSAIKSEEDK